MSYKTRKVLEDKAKEQIIKWATANPYWTPESLKFICNFFIKHYGLKNRYLPLDFKKEKQEENNDDITRTETNPTRPS
jgi:hypothetical protein